MLGSRLIKAVLLATTSSIVMASAAHADPITAAIAATASSVISAGGIGAFTFLGLQGFAAVAASFLFRAALGYAMNALSARDANKASSTIQGYTANNLGPVLPHAVIYGETKVGGAIFYQTTTGTNNRYFHRCIAFAGHEIESYEAIYFDDDELTIDGSGNVTAPSQYVGYARIKEHLGTDTQAADSDLVSEVTEWTTAHQAKGVAYLYIRFDYNTTAFPNGLPKVTARVRGKKVYDPRDLTTAWSNNVALCLRDYLTSDYGLGAASSEINDVLFQTAADICDETVSSAARYTCNGAFLLDTKPESIIRGLISAMGGMFWFFGGQWSCRAASYVSPTYNFTEDDLRSRLRLATRHSWRDNFNTVHGTYRGSETDWQDDDYPEVQIASYVTEDNNVESTAEFSLPFTDTAVMAQRLATIFLKRNRLQRTLTGAFGLRALDVSVGDTITLDNDRFGYSSKVFECVDWTFALTDAMDFQVNMILREHASSVYT